MYVFLLLNMKTAAAYAQHEPKFSGKGRRFCTCTHSLLLFAKHDDYDSDPIARPALIEPEQCVMSRSLCAPSGLQSQQTSFLTSRSF